MFSGDENHIVMNDRVQALAGSIYEEFEQVQRKQVMLSDCLPYPVPIIRIGLSVSGSTVTG
jgi:hypothetical protein